LFCELQSFYALVGWQEGQIGHAACKPPGHTGDCLQWEMSVCYSYLFCLLFSNVYFRSFNAGKIMQVSFCDLHSAVVYS